jgi:hypothetical protein
MKKALKQQMVNEIIGVVVFNMEQDMKQSIEYYEKTTTDISNNEWDKENGWVLGETHKARVKAYDKLKEKLNDENFIASLF